MGEADPGQRPGLVATQGGVRIPLYHRVYWRARLGTKLACLAVDQRPIVVGPWHGEVGFEILYWIPFLRRIQQARGISRERVHVISRGGVASWYRGVSDRYSDTFDYWTPTEFRERNAARKARTGREKQDDVSRHERALVSQIGIGRAHHLHPMFMYHVLAPFWTGQAPFALPNVTSDSTASPRRGYPTDFASPRTSSP